MATETKPAKRCDWTEDASDDSWDTECGNKFQLTQGTPYSNEMRWCCYCGGRLKQRESTAD